MGVNCCHNIEKNLSFENIDDIFISGPPKITTPKKIEPIISIQTEEIKDSESKKEDEESIKNNNSVIINKIAFSKGSTKNETISNQSQRKKFKKEHRDIELINEKLEKPENIKELLQEHKLILNGMDDSLVNLIINCINFLRIKKDVIFFDRNCKQDELYIITKGKINVVLNSKIYIYGKNTFINTNLLRKTNEDFYLKAYTNHIQLFSLKFDKYNNIIKEFNDKLLEERFLIIKTVYLFTNLDRKSLNFICQNSIIHKIKERKLLIKEDNTNDSIYILVDGRIIISKGDQVLKKISSSNYVFGEINLFRKETKNYFSYYAQENSEVYEIKFQTLKETFNSNFYSEKIIRNIAINSVKKCDILNQYFSISNIDNLLQLFDLKYYCNETIINKRQTKILLFLCGNIYSLINNKKQTLLIQRGDIIKDALASNNIILGCDETLVLEANWYDILKSIKFYTMQNFTLYEIINLLRQNLENKFNKRNLSEIKFLRIAESIKLRRFQTGEILIKEGPISDKYYIIVNGNVSEMVNDMEIRILNKFDSFGDIINKDENYQIRPTYIAKTAVTCFYIEKNKYETIMEGDFLKQFHSIMENENGKKNTNNKMIQLEQLYYIRDLGQGSYGKVYLVASSFSKQFYACKTAEIQAMALNPERAQYYLNEKSIMNNLEFTFIVTLYNTFKTRDYIFFLLEYIHGMTMRNYLDTYKKQDTLRNLDEVKFYAIIISLIIDYLQTKRIIHRDLKPDNLIIDHKGYLKAIDFGIAKDITGKDNTNTIIGTCKYMAPEIINGKSYSFSVDYWSMGIILYEWFYGKVPFGYGIEDPIKIYKEINERTPILPSDLKNEKFNDFLKCLLMKNPKKRIKDLERIKRHPLFENMDFDKVLKREFPAPFIPIIEPIIQLNDNSFSSYTHFTQFMKNHVFCSSTELDELIQKNYQAEDLLSDF